MATCSTWPSVVTTATPCVMAATATSPPVSTARESKWSAVAAIPRRRGRAQPPPRARDRRGPTPAGGRCRSRPRRRAHRGGQPHPVRADDGERLLVDAGAVGKGVVQSPPVLFPRPDLAEVGEPEAALGVEDDVVGAEEVLAVALVVEPGHLAGGRIHPFDPSPREVRGMRGAARELEGQDPVPELAPQEAAVVDHVDRPSGPMAAPLGLAAQLGHVVDRAVGYPSERAPAHLDQQHAVGHRNGALGELEPLGEDADVGVGGHAPET